MTDSNINIVEALRSKTEETDIKQYLKRTLSGYTKKSVLEYLNVLRKQQQAMADTFNHNQQLLFDEKEKLKKDNEALKLHILQVEAEYKNLSEALKSNELGGKEISASEIVSLKNKISALEEEINKSGIEKGQLENQIKQQNIIIGDTSLKLEQAEKQKLATEEMLAAEKSETKTQRDIVAQLSGKIEEKESEIKFLNSLVFEGQVESLNGKINELSEQLAAQTEVMAKCNDNSSLKSQTIETLTKENETLKLSLTNLSKTVEQLSVQNEKLVSANKVLTAQLEEEYKKLILLINEKSDITTEKLTAAKKLDEANSKIVMLEFQIKKLQS